MLFLVDTCSDIALGRGEKSSLEKDNIMTNAMMEGGTATATITDYEAQQVPILEYVEVTQLTVEL
jgi:hypothetical protein